MRTANLKLQQDSLFIPGWLVVVVGGHILVLLLFFVMMAGPVMANMPTLRRIDYPTADSAHPTPNPDALIPVLVTRYGGWAADNRWVPGNDLPSYFERALNAQRPGILVLAHGRAPWYALRRGLQAALDAGALRIEFQVLTVNGVVGSVPLDIHAPLPDLDDSARAQDVVDALTARNR